jgi:hypothetical protein
LGSLGYDLILVARNKARLQEMQKDISTNVKIIVADLSIESKLKEVYVLCKNENIDILINNAGFGKFGTFSEVELEQEISMIDTNVISIQVLTKLYLKEMKAKIDELEYQSGVTFSGGDPMMQVEALAELAAYVKEKGMNVWVYTGYTFEELMILADKNESYMKALEQIDVLVDGKFVMDLKSFDVQVRGSSNQRILDVKKSLEKKKAVKITKYK